MKRYVFIIIFIVLAVSGLRVTLAPDLHRKWKQENFWLKKANLQEKYDLLILGDSRALYAINPDTLLLNHRGYNYAFRSMSLTRRYLQKSRSLLNEKAHVILPLTPESLTRFESDKGLFDFVVKGPLLIHQGLKLVRTYWPQINLQQAILQKGISKNYLFPTARADQYHNNGWIEGTPENYGNESLLHHYKFLAQRYKIDQKMVEELVHELGRWSSSGIKVSFLWVCFDQKICEEEKKLMPEELKKSINKKLSSRGAHYLEMPGEFYSFDGDHLTGPEALRFSAQLAQKLKDL